MEAGGVGHLYHICLFLTWIYLKNVYMHSQELWVKLTTDIVNVIVFLIKRLWSIQIKRHCLGVEVAIPGIKVIIWLLFCFHTKVCLLHTYSWDYLRSAYGFSGILLESSNTYDSYSQGAYKNIKDLDNYTIMALD